MMIGDVSSYCDAALVVCLASSRAATTPTLVRLAGGLAAAPCSSAAATAASSVVGPDALSAITWRRLSASPARTPTT